MIGWIAVGAGAALVGADVISRKAFDTSVVGQIFGWAARNTAESVGEAAKEVFTEAMEGVASALENAGSADAVPRAFRKIVPYQNVSQEFHPIRGAFAYFAAWMPSTISSADNEGIYMADAGPSQTLPAHNWAAIASPKVAGTVSAVAAAVFFTGAVKAGWSTKRGLVHLAAGVAASAMAITQFAQLVGSES